MNVDGAYRRTAKRESMQSDKEQQMKRREPVHETPWLNSAGRRGYLNSWGYQMCYRVSTIWGFPLHTGSGEESSWFDGEKLTIPRVLMIKLTFLSKGHKHCKADIFASTDNFQMALVLRYLTVCIHLISAGYFSPKVFTLGQRLSLSAMKVCALSNGNACLDHED